jgi:diacylglycerol kinase family enzyme
MAGPDHCQTLQCLGRAGGVQWAHGYALVSLMTRSSSELDHPAAGEQTLNIDGELSTWTPARLRVVPRAVRVLA